MSNVVVKIVDMPHTVRGCTVRCCDDEVFYTIMLNSRLSADMQLKAYRHELEHIASDDFACNLNADDIEKIRHD